MTPFNVLFLDVDGVLNSHDDPEDFVDAQKIILLKKIVDATDAKIVLSSTWRHSKFDLIKCVLFSHKLEIYDITSCRFTSTRPQEINWWVVANKRKIKRFAILDDHPWSKYDRNGRHLFQTNSFVGLTEEIVEKVIAHLNKEKIASNE